MKLQIELHRASANLIFRCRGFVKLLYCTVHMELFMMEWTVTCLTEHLDQSLEMIGEVVLQ